MPVCPNCGVNFSHSVLKKHRKACKNPQNTMVANITNPLFRLFALWLSIIDFFIPSKFTLISIFWAPVSVLLVLGVHYYSLTFLWNNFPMISEVYTTGKMIFMIPILVLKYTAKMLNYAKEVTNLDPLEAFNLFVDGYHVSHMMNPVNTSFWAWF